MRNLQYMLMLGFFENVISFGLKITLIKSGVFGVRDFAFATARGFFVFFPIWFIHAEERRHAKYARLEQTRTAKASQSAHVQAREELASSNAKIKRVPHKSFFLTNPKMNFLFFRNKAKKFSSNRVSSRFTAAPARDNKLSLFSRAQAKQDSLKYKIYISSFGDLDKPVSLLRMVRL